QSKVDMTSTTSTTASSNNMFTHKNNNNNKSTSSQATNTSVRGDSGYAHSDHQYHHQQPQHQLYNHSNQHHPTHTLASATGPIKPMQQSPELAKLVRSLVQEEYNMDMHLDTNERKAKAAVRHALRNSQRLDVFRVDRILGFGSNGVVIGGQLRAQPEVHVAIKIIYKASNANKASASLSPAFDPIPNEIQVLEHLTTQSPHPSILKSMGSWQDEKYHYLISELHGTDWLNSTPGIPTEAEDPYYQTPVNVAEFDFLNPRLHRVERMTISPGASDLWAWSIAQKESLEFDSSEADQAATFSGPLPPEYLRKGIFRQLAAAVYHLHSSGIVHGDIKEENVLLAVPAAAGNMIPAGANPLDLVPIVKLCDFGHAVRAYPSKVVSHSHHHDHHDMDHHHHQQHTTSQRSPSSFLNWLSRDRADRSSTSTSASATTTDSNTSSPSTLSPSTSSTDLSTIPIPVTSYGTPEMRAPEMIPPRFKKVAAKRVVDGRSADVFALGILLFALCHGAGKLPEAVRLTTSGGVGKDGERNMTWELPTFGYYPLDDMDPRVEEGCRDLIRRMTMIDPNDRITMAEVLGHPWLC
ncbi:hypothetical protein HDU76_007704, partial [Blyttiomyces sp. JEL0837]